MSSSSSKLKIIEIEVNDFLKIASDSTIKQFINEEYLILSDLIQKVNHYGFTQERTIIITNKAIYNIKNKKLKRRIDITIILGLTFSSISNELVIHCSDIEYDYHYIYKKKNILLRLIANIYEDLMKKEIKFHLIDTKSLKHYVTTKKEKKRDSSFSKMPLVSSISPYSILGIDKSKNNQRVHRGTLFSRKLDFKEIKMTDFKILKVLGHCSTGKILLVRFIPNGEVYSMKTMKKDSLMDQDLIEKSIIEKKIFEKIDHQFLIHLIFCFQSSEKIHFVMPYIKGGGLFENLQFTKIFDEEKVKFFSIQIAIALNYLHSNNIVFRYLNPENISIDETGYIKISDFGMALLSNDEEIDENFYGKHEYCAPEVISGGKTQQASDWWSLGILIYEMFYGSTPFFSENIGMMCEMIKKSELTFTRILKIPNEAKDLMSKLLEKDVSRRITNLEDFKNHPFFKKTDFDSILMRKVEAPDFKEIVEKCQEYDQKTEIEEEEFSEANSYQS